MSVLTLQANRHFSLMYTSPWIGPVHYDVESELPVSIFVFDGPNLVAWRAGQQASYLHGVSGIVQQHQDLFLPSHTQFYFTIANFNLLPTAVYYNVRT